MVYGGIIIPSVNVPWFKQQLSRWRQTTGMSKELKWTKVSRQKYAEYASLIDLMFEMTRAGRAAFKSLVIDTSTPDYARYRTENPELGFYKGYYHFLHRDFGPYARTDEHSLHVLLDQRPSKYKLEVLQIILNRGLRKSFRRGVDVVKRLQEGDSKDSDLLQLTDVIMGAIGFHCNGLHRRSDASAAKVKLADYVAKKARLNNLHEETRRARQDFEIRFFRAGRKRWFRPRVPTPPRKTQPD